MFKFKSIAMKIAVMVLTVSILLSAMLIYASAVVVKQMLVKSIEENGSLNAQRYNDVIELWFNERIHEMTVYANSSEIKTMDFTKSQAYLNHIRESNKEKYYTFFISDISGNYRSIDEKHSGNIKNKQYVEKVIKGQTMISNISVEGLRDKICIAIPIHGTDNSIIGILGAVVEMSEIQKNIKEVMNGDVYNTRTYIVDKDGYIAVKLTKNIETKTYESILKDISNSKEGFIEFKEGKSEQYLYYFTMPNTDGWKIVSQVSIKELYSPVRTAMQILGGVGLLAIIFATIMSIFAGRTLSKPIIKLNKLFNKAAKGELTVRAEYKSKDEIGKVAESFNIMMDTISKMTYYDSLTGLPNLNFFNNRLDTEINHRKVDKKKLGVAIISIDKFKKINDMFGYIIGDKLLQEIGLRISHCIGERGIVCRASGDEFMLFISELNVEKDIVKMAGNLLKIIKRTWIIDEYEGYVTASIGISIYPNDGLASSELINNAGIAKSRAKELGGDKFELNNPTINEALKEQLTLDNLLYNALDRKEFIVHYQPLISVNTGKVVGAEALIRWNSPELGMVSPAKFIPIAEANGLIISIGEWVLREACYKNTYWHSLGFNDMIVSVNVSTQQFDTEDFINKIDRILKETGLEPQYLELEITEGLAMNDVEDKIEKLNLLKKMGIKIAIDDFGTGYSSLSYLKKFPVDSLKIDQSFVKDIPENASSTAIAATIVSMGNNLHMEIIAEGVETREQFEFIKKEKCSKAQGYFFSKPIEASQLELILKNNICYT